MGIASVIYYFETFSDDRSKHDSLKVDKIWLISALTPHNKRDSPHNKTDLQRSRTGKGGKI